jgi:protein-tyrosine phosphatase
MTMVRTSATHPLRIDTLNLPGGGQIGITFCPGKQQSDALTGRWVRDLEADLKAIREWGASVVITLIEDHEFAALSVHGLGEGVRAVGMTWHHLPIPDMAVPDMVWEQRWKAVSPLLHALLDDGGQLLVHCKGGLGRAGTVAGRLLIERGYDPAAAMARVRAVRMGAIENVLQEQYLRGLA